MRRSVVCLEMGICETALCTAALFGSKTLSTYSKFFLNKLSLFAFCTCNMPGNNKTGFSHIISLIARGRQIDCCLFKCEFKEASLSDLN